MTHLLPIKKTQKIRPKTFKVLALALILALVLSGLCLWIWLGFWLWLWLWLWPYIYIDKYIYIYVLEYVAQFNIQYGIRGNIWDAVGNNKKVSSNSTQFSLCYSQIPCLPTISFVSVLHIWWQNVLLENPLVQSLFGDLVHICIHTHEHMCTHYFLRCANIHTHTHTHTHTQSHNDNTHAYKHMH